MRANTAKREIRVQTVERSLMILEVMAKQSASLPLTQIGKLVQLNLSTTYRLLNTLCRSGFVEREKGTGNYRLGLKAFLIGNTVLQRIDLREIALPYLNALVPDCNESVYLAILANQNVIYTDGIKTAGPIHISIQTGMGVSACQTSAGKILLANLEQEELTSIINQYFQDHLINSSQEFLAELHKLRLQQYFIGISGFNETIHEISVPVYNHVNHCAGAISIFYQQSNANLREREFKLLEQLKGTAFHISQAMGHRI